MNDPTHDPARRSWVASANDPTTDFPIQNLPYARFRRKGKDEPWRIGVAIGDQIVDLAVARQQVPWSPEADQLLGLLGRGDLYALMTAPPDVRRRFRRALWEALEESSLQGPFLEFCLVPQKDAEYALPCRIGDYSDFYTSIHHATAVGRMFRPDNPLLPNYKWVPIGYHGRASSIRVGPHEVRRPRGQLKPPGADMPSFGPCKRLDFELEMGVVIGGASAMGEMLTEAQAEAMIFGFVLLNDWSARDIQQWEYVPLGPFQAKAFATSISPWVVTREALEPFRVKGPVQDPQPLSYLRQNGANNYDLNLDVELRANGAKNYARIARTNFKYMYWSSVQQLVHHASGGCAMNVGDLLGSGTISGPEKNQRGSLLEISWNGTEPLDLPGGDKRTFLEDGDSLVMRGWCQGDGYRVGFGEVEGTIRAAGA